MGFEILIKKNYMNSNITKKQVVLMQYDLRGH